MANRKIRYVGPIDEVALRDAEGRIYTVQRNHQVEVPEELAKGLNQQDDWEYVKSERSERTASADEGGTPA